ncbi:hypothetical protein PTKIN_Ptkin06aG0085600 [Pterospermum kingtungense]
MEKAQIEIDSVVRRNRIVEQSDIENLPYLQAIIKETLRLHPAGPLSVRESTEDCMIGSYEIPVEKAGLTLRRAHPLVCHPVVRISPFPSL